MPLEDEIAPIYSFDELKQLLESNGIEVGKAVGYKVIANEDVDLRDFQSKKIDFRADGINLIGEHGEADQKIFLYKRNYRMRSFGKPKFHIRKCKTIDEFISRGQFVREYRRANSDPVMVIDMDDMNKDKSVDNLPICKNCLRLAIAEARSNMTSKDFVEILKAANKASEDDNQEVDIFGYTKDWEEISRAYRESKNFTCERCGVQITDAYERQYIHVHHKNGNKLNNRTENLECLCIKCHSEVDATHRNNFSKGAKNVQIRDFMDSYGSQRNPRARHIFQRSPDGGPSDEFLDWFSRLNLD